MGTATGRVLSTWQPPWMAMVSSRIDLVPPLLNARQPVRVKALGHGTPGPRSAGADVIERVRVEERWISPAPDDQLVHFLQFLPVLGRHAVKRQDGQIVAFVQYVAASVATVLAQQTGRLVLGMALEEHHVASADLFGGHAPPNLVGLNGNSIAGVHQGVQGRGVVACMRKKDLRLEPKGEGMGSIDLLGKDTCALRRQSDTLD